MGKFLIIGGILLIIVGFGGTMISAFSGVSQIGNIVTSAENTDDLCNEGETLDEVTGASEYTPGQGYGRSVRYFCVDANGSRREVTGAFVEGLFGSVGNIFSGVTSGFPFMIVIMVGVLLLIIGVFVSLARRINARPTLVSPYGTSAYYPSGAPTGTPTGTPPAPYTQTSYTTPSVNYSPVPPHMPPDLVTRLRQLDEARGAGFVTQQEYDLERQRIMNEMRSRGL